jgi:hypothetical protein
MKIKSELFYSTVKGCRSGGPLFFLKRRIGKTVKKGMKKNHTFIKIHVCYTDIRVQEESI